MSIAGSLWGAIQGEAWDDLRFPAQGINPAGAVDAPSVDTTDYPGTLLFVHNATKLIAGVAQLPHAWVEGSAIRPHVHWSKTTSASGGVVWQFCYAIGAIGGTFGTYSEWADGTPAVADGDTAHLHALDSFPEVAMPNCKGSAMVAWQIRRKHDATGDDYGAAARLWEFDFHYRVYGLGSEQEFPT
jgi:hypothetical protein